jgi:hypothetical protein
VLSAHTPRSKGESSFLPRPLQPRTWDLDRLRESLHVLFKTRASVFYSEGPPFSIQRSFLCSCPVARLGAACRRLPARPACALNYFESSHSTQHLCVGIQGEGGRGSQRVHQTRRRIEEHARRGVGESIPGGFRQVDQSNPN